MDTALVQMKQAMVGGARDVALVPSLSVCTHLAGSVRLHWIMHVSTEPLPLC